MLIIIRVIAYFLLLLFLFYFILFYVPSNVSGLTEKLTDIFCRSCVHFAEESLLKLLLIVTQISCFRVLSSDKKSFFLSLMLKSIVLESESGYLLCA